MANSPAWTRKEGKNPEGGLNEKGRASLRAAGHDIKRPQPEGGSRKDSFCARMKGMKAKLTSSETANDPNSRINKSLRKWNCHADGGIVKQAMKIIDHYAPVKKLAKETSVNLDVSHDPMAKSTYLHWIENQSGEKGQANKVLKRLTDIADSQGHSIYAEPFNAEPKLVNYYKSHGFDIHPEDEANILSGKYLPGGEMENEQPPMMIRDPAKKADGGAIDVARQYRDMGGKLKAKPEVGSEDYWRDRLKTYAKPFSERGGPDDPIRSITPEEYRKGNLGHTEYALATGGRAGYATGGDTQLDPTREYVNSLYQNIMGRQGEQGGVDYWTDQLNQGALNQANILQNFARSSEFQNLYKQDPTKAVNSLYQTALFRAPEQSGLDYWVNKAKQGTDLGDIVGGFVNSNEGRNVQDLNMIYQGLSGKVATPEQIQRSLPELSADMDYFDFINKTFPAENPEEGLEYARRAGTMSDASGKVSYAPSDVWQQISKSPVSAGGRGFLDLIGSGEGGYDTARVNTGKGVKSDYGYTIGDNPLSGATIADVLAAQQAGKVNAVGKYQFIPKVLREIMQQSGIDPNQKFDQAMQDKLALFRAYNQRPKLKAFLEGSVPDNPTNRRAAMIQLAQEWASMPHPDTGRTIYSGNKAHHSIAQIRAALDAARGNMWDAQTQTAGLPNVGSTSGTPGLDPLVAAGVGGNVGAGSVAPIAPTISNPAPAFNPSYSGGWEPPALQPYVQPQPYVIPPGTNWWDQTGGIGSGGAGGAGSIGGGSGGGVGGTGVGGGSVGSGGFSVGFGPGFSHGGAVDIARSYRKSGGPIWDKPRPKRLGKPEKLTPGEKSSAKEMAKAAGRPYPNLVDNMRAAREEGGRLRPFMEAKIEEIGDKELGKYGIGPNAPSSTKDELKAGPEQSTWESIASKAMGDRPSPERRRFVEGMGNIADVGHMGAYATPLAPYVGAADFARGVASGDPMEAALGATGLPGKGAKAVGMAASAMMPEEAKANSLSAAIKAMERAREMFGKPSSSDAMGVFHSLYQNKIPKLAELGGIPAPSLSITKPQLAPAEFGDVMLVGRPHLAVPSEKNLVHGSDMFSSRFPRTENVDGQQRIVKRGYYGSEPLTMKSAVKHMTSGPMRGAEEGTEGASGRIIMNVNNPITSLEELMKVRHKLPETRREHTEGVEDLNRNLDALGGLLHQYQTDPRRRDYSEYLAEAMNAKLERGPEAFSKYYKDLGKHEYVPRSIEQTAREVRPDYFEAKPMRGVPFNEFAGALVENDKYGKMAAERLESAGIPSSDIHYSDLTDPDKFGHDIYKKFGEHLFQDGGRVEAAGGGAMTKFLRELAEQYRSHYDPAARIKGLPTTIDDGKEVARKWFSAVNMPAPEDISFKTTGQRQLIQPTHIDPQDVEGKALVTGFGDRAAAGHWLTEVEGRKLKNPVNAMGGPGFMLDTAAQSPDFSIWASAEDPAGNILKRARKAEKQGYEPVFSYVAQAPEGMDYSHHMMDTVLGQLNRRKMDPELVKKFDQRMREKKTGSGDTFMPKPDWVGISSPDVATRMAQRADERVKAIKLMDAAAYRDAPGFANIGASRIANTDPRFMFDPTWSGGRMMAKINPNPDALIKNPRVEHPSYSSHVPAAPGAPGYMGGFEYELPPQLYFKKFLEQDLPEHLRDKPFPQQTMSLYRTAPTVVATPEWVDTASEWQDLMRSLYGKRSP